MGMAQIPAGLLSRLWVVLLETCNPVHVGAGCGGGQGEAGQRRPGRQRPRLPPPRPRPPAGAPAPCNLQMAAVCCFATPGRCWRGSEGWRRAGDGCCVHLQRIPALQLLWQCPHPPKPCTRRSSGPSCSGGWRSWGCSRCGWSNTSPRPPPPSRWVFSHHIVCCSLAHRPKHGALLHSERQFRAQCCIGGSRDSASRCWSSNLPGRHGA